MIDDPQGRARAEQIAREIESGSKSKVCFDLLLFSYLYEPGKIRDISWFCGSFYVFLPLDSFVAGKR